MLVAGDLDQQRFGGGRAGSERLIAPLRDVSEDGTSSDILYADGSGKLHGRRAVLSALLPFRGGFWDRLVQRMQWSLFFHEDYHQRLRRAGRTPWFEEIRAYLAQASATVDVFTGRSEQLWSDLNKAPFVRPLGLKRSLSRGWEFMLSVPAYFAGRVVAVTNVGAFMAESAGRFFLWPGYSMAGLFKTASALPSELTPSRAAIGAALPAVSALQETIRGRVWEAIAAQSLLVNPGMPGRGHAILVDGAGATVDAAGDLKLDRAVALTLFQRLRALNDFYDGLSGTDRETLPLHVDLLLPQNLGLDQVQLRAAFKAILQTAGEVYPISEALLDRVVFNVRQVGEADHDAVVSLVREYAHSSLNTQVVTGRQDFWARVQSRVPEASLMIVLAGEIAVELARLEVEVVFTGAAAQALRRWIGEDDYRSLPAEVKDGENFRFKAMQLDPVKDLEDSDKKIRLFNIQA